MDRRYREELEQVRLTEESKRELVRALEARRELAAEGDGHRRTRCWSRTAVAVAALIGVLVLSVGGGGDRLPGAAELFR